MSNWFKRAWNHGIPIMDEYSDGYRPPSSRHRKDPRSLVNAKPEFGGEFRDKDHHRGTSAIEQDKTDYAKLRGHLPGENVLMDQDPPTGEGVNGDQFTGQGESNSGEFYADNDRVPTNESKNLDRGPTGPNNMQRNRGNIFNRVKNKAKIRSLNIL